MSIPDGSVELVEPGVILLVADWGLRVVVVIREDGNLDGRDGGNAEIATDIDDALFDERIGVSGWRGTMLALSSKPQLRIGRGADLPANLFNSGPGTVLAGGDAKDPLGLLSELRRADSDGVCLSTGVLGRDAMDARVQSKHEPSVLRIQDEVAASQKDLARRGNGSGVESEAHGGENLMRGKLEWR